eukprot:c28825_g1_i1 orf=217-1113(+)
MGSLLSHLESSPMILRFVVHVIEFLTKPPTRPLDFTQPARIEQESPEALIERARIELGINSVNDYNFAVVGASGVGKSSFVNGIRLLSDSDPDAAPVGETETTMEIKKFPHPLLKHVVLWDFPGAGTPGRPSNTYFSDMKLYAFDCILILSSDRFLKVDFDVAKSALAYKTRCAFVRTKADLGVKSIAEREGITGLNAGNKLRETVEGSFTEGLNLAGLSSTSNQLPLFLVSNKAFTDLNAYTVMHETTEELDLSLDRLDEDKIYGFIADSVRTRTLRTISLKPPVIRRQPTPMPQPA